MNTTVLLEERENGLYYIGISDGEKELFIFVADTYKAAKECASELKSWLEGLYNSRNKGWVLN